ncbi:septal ring lytic transglycosylase RlpA family protein [Flavobacterium sp. HSC-61S13]|uniref:septal ring lytic transglycosylase RlpA family protein n=1 Tax=Flavobacterium sp. HSC-61S13 TaxID=2910963 RepID=UPI00209D0E32|nr:septal ring lytic transglycosylase RlpA family protein [Flavobacterium sp. HSC-61S13]MCP1996281.1 rare lipoprotein A [Flavobacterium sp. HSC-61S13]
MEIFKTYKHFQYQILLLLISGFLITSCSATRGKSTAKVYKKKAEVSYYHDKFNGRSTASGEVFSNSKLTAAHKKLPFGTLVRLTNLENNKSVDVKINDRGPFTHGRELDISKKAFMNITDNKNHGVLKVKMELLK